VLYQVHTQLTSGLVGRWTSDEEERLKQIVSSMSDRELNWAKVSQSMGGTRGRQQCSQKWQVPFNLF
jgi:hypothetical protein